MPISENLAHAIAAVCAERFDLATLNPDAIVIVPSERRTMKLVGWDDRLKGWRVAAVSGEERVVPLVADAYEVKRVAMWWGLGRAVLWAYPFDSAKPNPEVLNELLDEALLRAGGDDAADSSASATITMAN